MISELSDAELARAIAAGDDARRAERLLVERFAPRIRLYGIRHLGTEEAALDLIQDVVLKVLVAIREGRLKNAESLASFVLGTCRHVVWDARRAERKQRALAVGAAQLSEPVVSPPDPIELVRLMGCLHHLPERDSLVVRMSFAEDRTSEEIGRRLGISAGNVRVIRHRALARLAECLGLEVTQS